MVLPDLGTSLSVVLWLVSFALTLGLGMVRLFIFLAILLSLGSSFSVVGLVVFYLFWMVFFGMALLVVLTLLFLLLLVFRVLVIMFVFCMMLLLISCTKLLFLAGCCCP